MLKRVLVVLLLLSVIAAGCVAPPATTPAASESTTSESAAAEGADAPVELVMGSWRVDDVEQMTAILGLFTAEHPNITVKFEPTNPPDYNSALRAQLEGGTGPDVMYLRSYTNSRMLFADGFVESLADVKDTLASTYSEAALVPWSTLEGEPYGVPLIAVSHGIYYNKDIFAELGLEVPTTWEGLLETAQAVQDAGYIPFANASGDAWTIAEIVFMNLAPNFIGGRDGRLAYLNGERCFNDENAVAAFQATADLAPFLPQGQEALVYYDSQALFEGGQAAMWMGGSWDIPVYETNITDFEWGVFATPAREGQEDQYVTFHLDAGIGINAASEKKEAARTLLEWMGSQEFAAALANQLPGFFPIHSEAPAVENAHANEFLALNEGRGTDVRWAWDGLLDGTPDGYTLMQDGAIAVIKGEKTAQEAADDLQNGLAQWLEAAQNCAQ